MKKLFGILQKVGKSLMLPVAILPAAGILLGIGNAFLTLYMCNLIKEENLCLDVVSGGELYTAHKANFPMENILLDFIEKITKKPTIKNIAGLSKFLIPFITFPPNVKNRFVNLFIFESRPR